MRCAATWGTGLLLLAYPSARAAEPAPTTPLESAAASGDLAAVRHLLAAHPDLRADEPPTALMFAARGGNARVVRVLVRAGADLHARGEHDADALDWAIAHGRLDAARELLRAGVDPNRPGHVGRTPLGQALESLEPGDDAALVALLLDAGARLDAIDDVDSSILDNAAHFGQNADGLRLVLARASSQDLEAWRRAPALAWQARSGLPEMVRVLLDAGFDPNARDDFETSALERAAENGRADIAQMLLDAGAAPTLDALDIALYRGHRDVAALVAGHVVELDAALISVARYGEDEMVRTLVARGADPRGEEALMRAAQFGHEDVVLTLLAAGADPAAPSALPAAAGQGDLELVKLLAAGLPEAGPQALLRAVAGDPTDLPISEGSGGHTEVVAWLLEQHVSADASDFLGVTALARAAQEGNVPVVALLLSHGARDLPNDQGLGALQQLEANRAYLLEYATTAGGIARSTSAYLIAQEPRWEEIRQLLAASGP